MQPHCEADSPYLKVFFAYFKTVTSDFNSTRPLRILLHRLSLPKEISFSSFIELTIHRCKRPSATSLAILLTSFTQLTTSSNSTPAYPKTTATSPSIVKKECKAHCFALHAAGNCPAQLRLPLAKHPRRAPRPSRPTPRHSHLPGPLQSQSSQRVPAHHQTPHHRLDSRRGSSMPPLIALSLTATEPSKHAHVNDVIIKKQATNKASPLSPVQTVLFCSCPYFHVINALYQSDRYIY